ncbi:MAG: TetR family transcriptional regulator [Alphaproteobacteria bacterium]|nr:TetR family transcriptional regulator [Alphaproteobacteria bacterium]
MEMAEIDEGRPADEPKLSTKEKILDAAEELFAERGYYGVSIRQITQHAGVDLALANYHFGPKEELFRHVIARRAEEHSHRQMEYLQNAIAAAGDGPPSIEALVRAFCEPIFDRTMRGGPGWKHYIQLLSHTANTKQSHGFLAPMNERYDPVVEAFTDAFKRALPACAPHNVHYAVYFLQGAIVYLLAETGAINRQSHGLVDASDFDAILERMVPFFAAGFYALAGRP